MITRNKGIYEEGRYTPKRQTYFEKSTIRKSNSNKTPSLCEMINSLNFNIFNSLKINRSSGLIVSFKVEISSKVFNYLEAKYQLKRQYKQNLLFLSEFDLIKERRISERCTAVIDEDFFLVKLMKKNDIIQENQAKRIRGLCYLSIKFSKSQNVKSYFD
jgi:hypothetical protein